MVHKGDIKIVSKNAKKFRKIDGDVKFKAPLVLTAPNTISY